MFYLIKSYHLSFAVLGILSIKRSQRQDEDAPPQHSQSCFETLCYLSKDLSTEIPM